MKQGIALPEEEDEAPALKRRYEAIEQAVNDACNVETGTLKAHNFVIMMNSMRVADKDKLKGQYTNE